MKTIVYRQRTKTVFEVGEISLKVPNINRTGVLERWCDYRICETWGEDNALRIVKALTNQMEIVK